MTARALIGWQEWLPELRLVGRDRLPGSLGRDGQRRHLPCGRPVASASSFPGRCRNPEQKSSSSPPASEGLGFMETVRLIQNMCKMIFLQAKSKDSPFGCGREAEVPLHAREAAVVPCAGTEKKRELALLLLFFLLTLPSWTRAGVLSAPEKLSYTTQLCDSSQQK